MVEKLGNRLAEAEVDRSERLSQLEGMSNQLAESEVDREKRLDVIVKLEGKLLEVEKDRSLHLGLIEKAEKDGQSKVNQIEKVGNENNELETLLKQKQYKATMNKSWYGLY